MLNNVRFYLFVCVFKERNVCFSKSFLVVQNLQDFEDRIHLFQKIGYIIKEINPIFKAL